MMAHVKRGAGRRERGIALIEVLAALAIGALLMAGLAGLVQQWLDDLKGQQSAYHQAQVVQATRNYLAANAALVASQTPAPGTVVPLTLAQLRAGGLLPAGFGERNPYGQGSCVLVRQPDPVSHPGRFDALIVTTGGEAIPAKDLAAVAMQAGDGGGYIGADTPGTARGASWQLATGPYRGVACPGGAAALQGTAADAGHLVSNVFHDGASQQAADYLYRNAVPGRPEVNRMNTPLRLGGAAVAVAGAACLNGAGLAEPGIAVDGATRALLTCAATGTWTLPSSWKEPVATYAALAPLATGPTTAVGDVRMVTALKRAFAFDGAGWVALAVDQDGNLEVPGSASAAVLRGRQRVESEGTMRAATDLTVGQDVLAGRDVRAERDLHAAHDVRVANTVWTKGLDASHWLSTPAATLWAVFAPGDACNYEVNDPATGLVIAYPYGTIVADATRRPLICAPDNTFRYANGQYTIN